MLSRSAAVNRLASALGSLAALALALLVATGLGIFSYAVTAEADPAEQSGMSSVMFGMLSFIYLIWATVPLSLSGGGNQFDPGRLLLYPISLHKLFALDLVSELTSLASIFALPCLLAVAAGAGLGSNQLWKALLAAVCASAFGIALAKLLTTATSALTQRKRARGENVVALIGTVGGVASLLVSQLMMRSQAFPDKLRWTPPGAVATALTTGLRSGAADASILYWLAIATLMLYTVAAIVVAYHIARRMSLGLGGRKQSAARGTVERSAAEQRWGWQLLWMSPQVSAIVEKELRYGWRNAQLRTMVLMPVLFTFWFRFMQPDQGDGRGLLLGSLEPFAEGIWTALGVLYIFMFTSTLSSNIFGFDGAGTRMWVLAPVERRLILIGKNIAVTFIAFAVAAATTLINWIVFRDLSPQGLIFTVLCFLFFAAVFATIGNWLSVLFPKRLQFGKKMNASGVASLLLVAISVGAVVPPAGAVAAGYFTGSLAVEYAILTALATAGPGLYILLIKKQGRMLAERELDILEAATGRSDD